MTTTDGTKGQAMAEREEFEAQPEFVADPLLLDRGPDGSYHYVRVQGAWDGWKARAALSAPAVPDGFKLVPIEPTDAMIDATYHGQPLDDIWRDMVTAAPQPQEPQK